MSIRLHDISESYLTLRDFSLILEQWREWLREGKKRKIYRVLNHQQGQVGRSVGGRIKSNSRRQSRIIQQNAWGQRYRAVGGGKQKEWCRVKGGKLTKLRGEETNWKAESEDELKQDLEMDTNAFTKPLSLYHYTLPEFTQPDDQHVFPCKSKSGSNLHCTHCSVRVISALERTAGSIFVHQYIISLSRYNKQWSNGGRGQSHEDSHLPNAYLMSTSS